MYGEEIQSLLEGSRRNQAIFDRISRELGEAGYNKSATQCKDKLKKLKDGHDVSGTNRDNWEFFDVMVQVSGSSHSEGAWHIPKH